MSDRYGWVGTVLDIDLTSEKITKIPSDKYFLKFVGGRGLIAKVVWDDIPVGTKPFDPENRLVFAPGLFTGTNAPTSGRWRIGGLAPQHPKEYPSHSGIGGHWGAELKFAGYDGVIIHGKASQRRHILIKDGEVEFISADHLWGMDTFEVQKRIKEELANERMVSNTEELRQAGRYDPLLIRSVVIGRAGENKSRIATIQHDSGDAAGQGGFGGVMGSKNLKAISVRGTGPVKVARPKEMIETVYRARLMIRAKSSPILPSYGGPGGMYAAFMEGGNPKYLAKYMKRTDGCWACQLGCRAFIEIPNNFKGQAQCFQQQMYFNWESIGPMPPLPEEFKDRKNDETAWYGNKLADFFGINAVELTGFLSWLWAGYKEKIFTEENTGIPFHDFGSKAFADTLFGMIANREGFGDILAKGLYRASHELAEKFSPRVVELYEQRYAAQGQRQHWFYIGTPRRDEQGEIVRADPTGTQNPIGQLLWATDTRDPYSNTSKNRETYGNPGLSEYMYGTAAAANPFTYDGKAIASIICQHQAVGIDSLGLCDWVFPIQSNEPLLKEQADHDLIEGKLGDKTLEAQFFSHLTGIDTTYDEMMKYFERIWNLERAAQVRIGRTREDDTFNEFFFNNPDKSGRLIDRQAWEKLKDEFYELRGWDKNTGIPTKEKLEELDLKDVASDLGL